MKIKNKEVILAIAGSAFFAVPYLTLAVPFIPSLLIGAAAFTAGELILTSDNKGEKIVYEKLDKKIDIARNDSKAIYDMRKKIDDNDIVKYISEICDNANKIINTIEKDNKKIRNINNFFDYYLPVTLSIIKRYDEIENQDLSSKEMKEFTKNTKEMLKTANEAFSKILASLYQNDIINIDADMKVFNSMLKADGFDDEEIIKEDNNE